MSDLPPNSRQSTNAHTIAQSIAAFKAAGNMPDIVREQAMQIATLREALAPFVSGASHTRTFLATKEKMHSDGLKLFDDEVEAAKRALDESA